jgi:hypothetical protein
VEPVVAQAVAVAEPFKNLEQCFSFATEVHELYNRINGKIKAK